MKGGTRSEDPGDEEDTLEATVQTADQQLFKMADGKLHRRLTYRIYSNKRGAY